MRRLGWLCATALLPAAAQASFNGGGPCPDFQCYFLFFGLMAGVAGGIPVSATIFLCLHMFLHHPARSQRRQVFLGALLGFIAYEAGAAAFSFALLREQAAHPGQSEVTTLVGPAVLYLLMAAGSVLYVRSPPARG